MLTEMVIDKKDIKAPANLRESDFKKLLKSAPSLTRSTTLLTLPDSVLVDVRYVTCPESSRESILMEYVSTLPETVESREEEEKQLRREKALRDREWVVECERRRNRVEEERAKELLRGKERAVERAKMVGKKGLKSHLGLSKDNREIENSGDAKKPSRHGD
jgi:hypothetical protein